MSLSATARALSVAGLLNVRDLGGLTTTDGRRVRSRRVVRSDNLRGLTDEGALVLVEELRPRLVVDLRTEQECDREGRGLADADGVRWVNVPLKPKAAVTPEQLAQGLASNLYEDYLLQLQDNAAAIVRALTLLADDGGTPAVVHCTAGKDRTGIVIAVLLELLGVDREQVVADYGATAANMPGVLARIRASPFFRSNGLAEAPAWIFDAAPETMRDALAWLDGTHGGAYAWAMAAGLAPEAVERLRAGLLEDLSPEGVRVPAG